MLKYYYSYFHFVLLFNDTLEQYFLPCACLDSYDIKKGPEELILNPNLSPFLSMVLGPLVDLRRFFSYLIYTQSIGLLTRGISPSQGRYLHTEQQKHRINARRHPCLEWDSNPRSQCSSGRRKFMP
jgi:hypothetical protein